MRVQKYKTTHPNARETQANLTMPDSSDKEDVETVAISAINHVMSKTNQIEIDLRKIIRWKSSDFARPPELDMRATPTRNGFGGYLTWPRALKTLL